MLLLDHSFRAYAGRIAAIRQLSEQCNLPFTVDQLPRPSAMDAFYDRVANGPHHVGLPVYVIFIGTDVGVTTDECVGHHTYQPMN